MDQLQREPAVCAEPANADSERPLWVAELSLGRKAMKGFSLHSSRRRKLSSGFTFMELLVATAIGSILLATLGALSINGARTFATIGNYSDLESKSRNAL